MIKEYGCDKEIIYFSFQKKKYKKKKDNTKFASTKKNSKSVL